MEVQQNNSIGNIKPTTDFNDIVADGFATAQDSSIEELKAKQRQWNDADLTAQCFLFFVAGFETSASLMCVTVHELAENQYVQAKLYAEIKATQKKLNGKRLNYEQLQEMKYLDMVVSGIESKFYICVSRMLCHISL